MENEKKLISVKEAAEILGLTRIRVAVLCKQGRFSGAEKIGSVWIIPRESVENFTRLPPGKKSKKEKNSVLIKEALKNMKESKKNGKMD